MTKTELMQIPLHATDTHIKDKATYIQFIKDYAEYEQAHFIEADLRKKYADIFFNCDFCGEYFDFYSANNRLTEKPKDFLPEEIKTAYIDKLKSLFATPLSQNTLIDEVQQLAAAGTEITQWFMEPIDFKASGIFIDIRQIKGETEKVSIYLKPSQMDYNTPPTSSEIEKIQNTLSQYAGKTIGLVISNHQHAVLEASIYISSDASEGEGTGMLIKTDDALISLRLELFIDE